MADTYNKIIGTEGVDWPLEGGAGADWLEGRGGDDRLDGLKGNDQLYGGKGDDRLHGREGDDQLYGGKGDDWLWGGADNDTLDGGEGNDFLFAKGDGTEWLDRRFDSDNGNDRLYGREGDDLLWGASGNDYLDGGEGDDKLYGYYGDDQLYGREGDDQLYGGNWGDDRLYGGEGNDFLDGDGGNDYLDGGEGNDWLIGRTGADTLRGGSSTDFFTFHRGDSLGSGDVITDFTVAGANRDALDLRAFNIDLTRDLKSQGLTLSGLMDADGDGATDDRKITLPDSGTITLLNLGSAALAMDDFAFAVATADGNALTIFDAGDAPEDQPDPEPEGDGGDGPADQPDPEPEGDGGDAPEDQPDPEPEGDGGDDLDGLIPPEGEGGALTNVDAGDEEEAQPETWLEQQLRLANTPVESGGANDGGRARRQVELNEGELVNVDAGELDGLTLPEDAGGAYSGRYGLYWNPGDSGRFQLRFDDAVTGALTPTATAAAIDAALEALNGITAAEVTGAPGDWTLTITADEGHLLQAVDVVEGVFFDGDLQLDYMGA